MGKINFPGNGSSGIKHTTRSGSWSRKYQRSGRDGRVWAYTGQDRYLSTL